MELKPGFKRTEIGWIPAAWEIPKLSDMLQFRNGVNADKDSYGTGIPFINVLEVITKSHLVADDVPGRVELPRAAMNTYAVTKGDILFNRTSETQEEVALASVYMCNEKVVFGGFVIRGRPLPNSALDIEYSGYGLRAPAVRSQIVARGQGAIRANVGQAELGTVLIPRPPLAEQRAIAAALSDVDALISSLDRLIAKKRDLKTAATQQLLSGRTRLPGFGRRSGFKDSDAGTIPSDWEARRILDVVRIANGQVDPTREPFRSMPLVGPDHIEGGTGRLLKVETAAAQNAISGKYAFQEGDVLYSKIRPHLRKATLAPFHGLCSADMYPLKPLDDVSSGFVLATLLGPRFSKYAESVSVRSGMPKINREELAGYSMAVPSGREQTAIAEVLADFNGELSELEARRDKTRLLKQGMMQELLTGRTRLV